MLKHAFSAIAFSLALAALPACQHSGAAGSAAQAEDEDLDAILGAMLRGESFLQGAALEAAIAEADKHPLGSDLNPVRVSGPPGQRAYLARLRCPGGEAPSFVRAGSVGQSVFGNIADVYEVTCPGTPAADVFMDMYHAGRIEDRPVPGFTIVPATDGSTRT